MNSAQPTKAGWVWQKLSQSESQSHSTGWFSATNGGEGYQKSICVKQYISCLLKFPVI